MSGGQRTNIEIILLLPLLRSPPSHVGQERAARLGAQSGSRRRHDSKRLLVAA